MSNKLEMLVNALHLAQVEPEVRKEVIRKFEELAAEEKAEKANSKAPKSKKQTVVVLKSAHDLKDLEIVAGVYQIGENEDYLTLTDKLRTAAVENNLAAKKKSNKLFKFSDILSFLKAKWMKQQGVRRITPDWVPTIQVEENFITEVVISE